jgi:small subunit ribosomal protein S1
MTNYGLFVELEEGVDGLVHVSDLSWTKKIKHPAEFVKKDQELDVMVLEVDLENRRLSLGHKQLDENPWDTFETIFTVGSVHEGTVLKIEDKSATIALPYGVEGYAPIKQLQREDKTTVKEDEVVDFKVTEFNKENKRIVVSHTALWKADAIEEKKVDEKKRTDDKDKATKAAKKLNDSNEKSTFADVEGFAALKAQLEKKD